MTGVDVLTTPDLVTGYRLWRVMPFHRLDGSSTVRLCAMGTYGNPKIWEPRQRTTANCSDYGSDHEAPWPEHVCGVWALKDETDTRRRMVAFMQTQGGGPVGWALGRVSLWGRLIEHDRGWRAQHAYPYALSVEAPDEEVARVLRREYAVDVEWAGSELFEKAMAKREAELAAEREAKQERRDAVARLKEIEAELTTIEASFDATRRPRASDEFSK